MSLTKTILRDFVNKVKEKAVKAVEEKNKQIMEEAIKEYFALHPEEKATFDRMQALVEELAKTATDLAVFVEDWTQINNYPHNLGLSNYFSGCLNYSGSSKEFEVSGEVLRNVFMVRMPKELVPIKKDLDQKLKEVKDTYSKIYNTVDSMTSPKKSLEYLKELGFDVTWCLNMANLKDYSTEGINKNILFPCGSNKAE